MAEEAKDMMDASTDIRVLLERMNGKMDIIAERQVRQQDDIKRIEERMEAVSKRIDERLHSHSNRLQVIEAQQKYAAGERAGIAGTAKVAYALGGGGVAAVIAAVLRSFHV